MEGNLSELSGVPLEGYEIHMGVSTGKEGVKSLTNITDYAKGSGQGKEKADGAYYKNIYGTYVHGVFDREEVAGAVIKAIGRIKGIDVSQIASVDFAAFKEQQYDILAAGLREHLNMEKIYEILNAGIGKDVSK